MNTSLRPKNPLIYAIIGPTASGKSDYAVKLAKKVRGEILSVDSRQIYRGLDIGSGKVKGQEKGDTYIYKSVPHYGINIASPKRTYSVAQFQKYAEKIILEMIARGKVPVLCGGTAHWMDAVAYGQHFPEIKPNKKLRTKLERKTTAQLFARLKKLDPVRASTIDRHNPRRLVRALEIVLSTKQPIQPLGQSSPYTITWVGLAPLRSTHPLEVDWGRLNLKIKKRLASRLNQGLFREVELLRAQGLSWKRLESFGLEYKYCALYLRGIISRQEAISQLQKAIEHYAKRQMTWWKRNKAIGWKSI